MSLIDLQLRHQFSDPPGIYKNYMQIGDQLAGHAKSELETDASIETGNAVAADTWLGGSAQADLEIKNLEALDEENVKPSSQEKDDEDLIADPHSLKDMDSGDVLAYSGEISGEFKSTESATTKATPAKESTTKPTTPQ
jgi:hypothetical protein